MPVRVRRPRGLAWVALAALAVLVASSLLASAGDPPAATWSTPPPRPGDRAHYDVREV
jgi:hypothetical protein